LEAVDFSEVGFLPVILDRRASVEVDRNREVEATVEATRGNDFRLSDFADGRGTALAHFILLEHFVSQS
jgi:hypothetical protein